MSSWRRRAEIKAEREARDAAEAQERFEKSRRTWFMKVEDAETVNDLKEILHRLCDLAGLE